MAVAERLDRFQRRHHVAALPVAVVYKYLDDVGGYLAPGAVGAALVWQLLQSFGVVYVSHVVRNSSETNGVFAVVLGLLAFLYLAAVSVVVCLELNAVRVDSLHPRALRPPFVESVGLTTGDRKAYSDQAEAQRMKHFQDIDIRFDEPAARLDAGARVPRTTTIEVPARSADHSERRCSFVVRPYIERHGLR